MGACIIITALIGLLLLDFLILAMFHQTRKKRQNRQKQVAGRGTSATVSVSLSRDPKMDALTETRLWDAFNLHPQARNAFRTLGDKQPPPPRDEHLCA